ncbi:hypothetical protein Tco_0694291 [Tanacetum coccineum]
MVEELQELPIDGEPILNIDQSQVLASLRESSDKECDEQKYLQHSLGDYRSWRHYGKVVTKNVMNKGESDQFQAMVGLVAVAPKGNGVDHLSYDPKLSTVTCDKLLSYSLHYKEIENGILGKGANPSAKGGGEDEDWARNATQVVSKGVDQI